MSDRHWSWWVRRWWAALVAVAVLAVAGPAAADLTVTVKDDAGQPITGGFRWLLEEDNTYGVRKTAPDGPWAGPGAAPSLPGTASPNADWDPTPGALNPTHTLSVNVHRSHAPVACAGDTRPADPSDPGNPPGWQSTATIGLSSCALYDPAKSYMVSVLPWHTSPPGAPPAQQTGYGMSGRLVAAGQTAVTVVVHPFPHPTAQVTVLVFEDNQPINGALDQPAEHGLGRFTLLLSDMAGQVLQDAFAYPIGTTYAYQCATSDGRPVACGPGPGCDAGCTPNPPGAAALCLCPNAAPLAQGQEPVFAIDPATDLPQVAFLGDGTVRTCPGPLGATGTDGYTAYQLANCVDPYSRAPLAAGEAVIRYLPMNKYAVEAVRPASGVDCGSPGAGGLPADCSDMLLTATLEGTRQNDAWVRAGEPRYFESLGALDWQVPFPFVHPMNALSTLPGAERGSISGQVVQVHDQHPPLAPGLTPGLPVANAYVGLNNLSGNDEQVYTAPADPVTGQFVIDDVPAGTYQLVMWDKAINEIMDFRTVALGPGQMDVDLGKVAVYGWFSKLRGHVFSDPDGDGLPAGGVPVNPAVATGIPNVPVNLRFTDGSVYQTTTTGSDGSFTFDQYFPFWRFLVAEVDAGRFRATGLTSVVDNGGPLPQDAFGALGINPQLQPPGGLPYRVEAAPAVTEAVSVYQDMTAYVAFGKKPIPLNSTGGIRGMVNYAATRTEEDPRTSAIDGWEPGVPDVTVTLHRAIQDQDCLDQGGSVNDCWVTDDGAGTGFPLVTTSDSWNDHSPEGCVSAPYAGGLNLWPNPEIVNGHTTPSCAETFANWDQSRPGVFDGAFAFEDMGDAQKTPIPPGHYIVEVTPPPGYEVLKWGDRNIEFGDPKIPFLVQPPPCVGAPYDVPQYHTLFPDQMVETDTTALGGPWYPGMQAAGCEQKLVTLTPGGTGAVNFNLFTAVPKAARIWGTIWNDLALEFNPASPNAAGNLGAAYIPVALKDWKGTEVARFYTDQWGHFDGLVPSAYDIAPPIPLGVVLNVYHVAPNDPGPVLDTRPGSPTEGQMIPDPWYNPAYSHDIVRENWEFYAGRTTFIDGIVLPVAGLVAHRVPLNCAYTDGTPELAGVSDVIVSPGQVITLTSAGVLQVPNPSYDPTDPASPLLLPWDHGFGDGGPGSKITVGGTDLPWDAWSPGTITVTIPAGVEGQLVVTRGDSGLSTPVGVTLRAVGPTMVDVAPPPAGCAGDGCAVIQHAIDQAPIGAVIVLGEGTYRERVNLWKPVSLQGKGAGVTVIDAGAAVADLALEQQTLAQIQALLADGSISLVPGQTSDFTLQAGAGILVAGCDYLAPGGCPGGNSFLGQDVRIDGLTITGASAAGGGILVNGFTDGVRISNDEVFANEGGIAGGIRVGTPMVTAGSSNPGVVIEHNRIAQNGSTFSGGGGIAMYSGADGYRIAHNMICGNFSAVYGGGIGHLGLSDGGVIEGNTIVANESFDEGGGVDIGGELPAGPAGLTAGSGSVLVEGNLIQGNKAGDDGGGIRTRRVNGLDVAANADDPDAWYRIDVFDNIVVNNSSADHGGGMALDDTVRARVVNNTVARNDSTATGSDAFGGPCDEGTPIGQVCPPGEENGGLVTSVPQVAGIASFAHSTPLYGALTAAGSYCESNAGDVLCVPYSNPELVDDILWQNRSFYWDATANSGLGGLVAAVGPELPDGYWDLAVYGAAPGATLSPTYSILTNGIGATPSATDLIGAKPRFLGDCSPPYAPPQAASGVGSCFNVYEATSKGTALGNFVTAIFSPVGIQGDYHIDPVTSPAIGQGSAILYDPQDEDIEGDTRSAPVDIGADQARPALSVSPGSLAFGAVPSGATSAAQPVVVTNLTGKTMGISAQKVGANPGMFTVAGPRSIPPGGSVTLNVAFAPTGAPGARSAVLKIKPFGAVAPPPTVVLSGTAQ